jgi:hypothetical protein
MLADYVKTCYILFIFIYLFFVSPSSQLASQEAEGGLCSWPVESCVAIFPTWNPKSEKANLALAQGAETRLERNRQHGPD